MKILAIILILCIFIVLLIIAAISQIRNCGINIKDFFSFIKANEDLDNLYLFAKQHKNFTPEEQEIYLKEAEKMFDAFDKIPSPVWEDEYDKYSSVLDTYKNIRVKKWNSNGKDKSK